MKQIFLILCLSFFINSCSNDQTTMNQIQIQHIRNATLKINYAGNTFLIDPMLGEKNSFMSFVEAGKNLNPIIDLPIPAEDIIAGIDAVFLTHPHMDHFDEKAQELLPKSVPFYTQPSDYDRILEGEFSNVFAIEDSIQFNEVTVYRTFGKHAVDPEMAKALGPVSGFVFQSENYPTLYIVGDCVYDKDIQAQIAQYNPDIIITNSGGAVLSGKRILMDETETIALIKANSNAQVLACHIESLDHCLVTRKSLRSVAEENKVTIIIPNDGEEIIL